jgi:hypothetical protein
MLLQIEFSHVIHEKILYLSQRFCRHFLLYFFKISSISLQVFNIFLSFFFRPKTVTATSVIPTFLFCWLRLLFLFWTLLWVWGLLIFLIFKFQLSFCQLARLVNFRSFRLIVIVVLRLALRSILYGILRIFLCCLLHIVCASWQYRTSCKFSSTTISFIFIFMFMLFFILFISFFFSSLLCSLFFDFSLKFTFLSFSFFLESCGRRLNQRLTIFGRKVW